jgi:hypothetical protein
MSMLQFNSLAWFALGGLFGGVAVAIPLLRAVHYWRNKAQNLREAHTLSGHGGYGGGF